MDMDKITGRLTLNLEQLKNFTATPGNGCTRLPFTKEARDAVNYLRNVMVEAGLQVIEDAAGNVFGIMWGEDEHAPCVMMGSHYDSVKNGGNFDGIAGVVAAIEVARLLKEKGVHLKRNFVVAGFCDEEGMRFGTGYFGSGAMLGHRDVEYCKKFRDNEGISIYSAMKSYGLDPKKIKSAAWKPGSIGQFLELHIEQGPVLDSKKIQIGIVDCIVGIQRYVVTVHGRADHAGTTPMNMRMDAMDAATKVIARIADWAREKNDGTVATVGYLKALPGGMNIVAEQVEFTVDIRSKNNDNINDIANKIKEAVEKEVEVFGGSYEIQNKLTITPVKMDKDMQQILEKGCKKYHYSYMYLSSGAGHDSLEIGQEIPTCMLFVPSRDGRSHCPVEFTKYKSIAQGSMLMSVLVEKLLVE